MTNKYKLSLQELYSNCKTAYNSTHHDAKFNRMPNHKGAFVRLKGVLIQAPILHYPDPLKWYIVYTHDSDDACGAQLSQENNGPELPVMFLSHTFRDTQWKWSTPEQEAYGVYYAITMGEL